MAEVARSGDVDRNVGESAPADEVERNVETPTNLDELLIVCGFSKIIRDLITGPGYERMTLDDLKKYTDDMVDKLAAGLSRQSIPGRTADAARVPVYVQVRAVENLKAVCYILRHGVRANRPIPVEYFTNDHIEQWKLDREFQEEYVEPTEAPKLVKNDETSILTFIEDFPDMLIEYTGCNGIPLAYVVREDEAVPHHSTDPMYLTEGSRYRSVREELTVRASISFTSANFNVDNRRVFRILLDAIKEFPDVKVWIKDFMQSRDGRAAWKAFKEHFLGSSQLDNVADRASRKLESLVYTGEKQRYTYETHVSHFKQAHLDLEKAGAPLEERTKVRQFLKSITAAELQTAVGIVRSQRTYMTNFEETINYLRGFVTASTPGVKIAAVSHSSGDSGAPPPKPEGCEFRWYKQAEWERLPESHKTWLRYEKRQRSKPNKKADKNDKRKLEAALKKANRKIAKLTKQQSKKANASKSGEESE